MATHKTESLKATALEHGWKATIIPDTTEFNGHRDSIKWDFFAKREIDGKVEKMIVRYQGDRMVSGTYQYGKYKLLPARIAPVLRLLKSTPDPRRFNGPISKQEPEKIVPFGPDAPAVEILKGVLDRNITYIKRIANKEKTVYVPPQNRTSKHFRVIESPPHSGRRILEFTNKEGFHAVALDQIVDVK